MEISPAILERAVTNICVVPSECSACIVQTPNHDDALRVGDTLHVMMSFEPVSRRCFNATSVNTLGVSGGFNGKIQSTPNLSIMLYCTNTVNRRVKVGQVAA